MKNTDTLLWELQLKKNQVYDEQIKMLVEHNINLLSIIEDHEKDMIKMANKINELERKLEGVEDK